MADAEPRGNALTQRTSETAFSIRKACFCPSPGIGFKTAFYSTN
jgi:hypothetical protein